MSLSSWPSSSVIVSSILPRELGRRAPGPRPAGRSSVSPLSRARRSAFETTFSRFAIDIRTDTPDCWLTCDDDRASREISSTISLM